VITVQYIAIFDPQFSSAYLASVIVQVIFLYYGPRYGVGVLAPWWCSRMDYHVTHRSHSQSCSQPVYRVVEATVGFMAWIFSAAAIHRDNALAAKEGGGQLAAQAVACDNSLLHRQ